jgi:hypothetical protein
LTPFNLAKALQMDLGFLRHPLAAQPESFPLSRDIISQGFLGFWQLASI